MKKIISIVISLIIVIGSFSFVYASDATPMVTGEEALQDNFSSLGVLVKSTDTYDEYVLTDAKQIAKEVAKDKVTAPKGKSVKKIITRIPKNVSPSSPKKDLAQDITTQGSVWLGYYIKSTTDRGDYWYFPDIILHTNSGGPGGTVSMTVNEEVSATVSCSVGLDAEVVSAEVGFDVTRTYGIQDSYSVQLAAGQYGMIKAWTYYHRVDYDVWNDYLIGDDTYQTTGSAYRPNGVRFRFYEL